MKKINLRKQEVFQLSEMDQNTILGGGIKRSRRREGDCAYSRKHPSYAIGSDHDGDGKLDSVGWCKDGTD